MLDLKRILFSGVSNLNPYPSVALCWWCRILSIETAEQNLEDPQELGDEMIKIQQIWPSVIFFCSQIMPVYCILSIHQYTLFLDMLIWWIFWDRRYNRDTVFCLFARRSRVPGFGLTPIALSRPRDFRILDLATETCGTPFSGHTTLGCSLPEAPDWADSRLSAREIVPWPWHDEWMKIPAVYLMFANGVGPCRS